MKLLLTLTVVCVTFEALTSFATAQLQNVSSSTEVPSTTTESPGTVCGRKSNTSCSECLGANTGCYFCSETKRCGYYPYRKIIPSHEECASFSEVYWGVCFISLQATVITISAVVAAVLLALTICCCCCCRRRKRNALMRENRRVEEERRERQAKAEERRFERKSKTDDIRRKYGLIKEDTPYTRI